LSHNVSGIVSNSPGNGLRRWLDRVDALITGGLADVAIVHGQPAGDCDGGGGSGRGKGEFLWMPNPIGLMNVSATLTSPDRRS
jgi:hypothetical protein